VEKNEFTVPVYNHQTAKGNEREMKGKKASLKCLFLYFSLFQTVCQ